MMTCGTIPFRAQHHTADNIREALEDCTDKWLAVDPVRYGNVWQSVCITTDCGANIAKAADLPGGKFFWMKCVLHILHNAVKAGMAAVGSPSESLTAFRKVRNFVTTLSRSGSKYMEFRRIQENIVFKNWWTLGTKEAEKVLEEGAVPQEENYVIDDVGEADCLDDSDTRSGGPFKIYRLVKPIDVRWSSYEHCIERVLLLKQAIAEFTQWALVHQDVRASEEEKVS